MKVAYIFSTQGHSVSYKLAKMILPQLENKAHGVEVAKLAYAQEVGICAGVVFETLCDRRGFLSKGVCCVVAGTVELNRGANHEMLSELQRKM